MKSDTTIYAGERRGAESWVTRDGRPLAILDSLAVRNHSPTGFNWGYGGSGPAQLALAILIDFTGNKTIAEGLYQDFKFAVIANLDEQRWVITGAQIRQWLSDNLLRDDFHALFEPKEQ
jgi:hypothetical protein